MKIEIKSRFNAEVLFSFECENNSIKLTMQAAVKANADLYGADLYGADLRDADLYGANLYGADLYGADLSGANLYGEKLTKTPLFILNLEWDVTITTQHLRIGCQVHLISEWKSFDDSKISEMAISATEFWAKYKAAIIALCDAHCAD